jgi:hypothetical protein
MVWIKFKAEQNRHLGFLCDGEFGVYFPSVRESFENGFLNVHDGKNQWRFKVLDWKRV